MSKVTDNNIDLLYFSQATTMYRYYCEQNDITPVISDLERSSYEVDPHDDRYVFYRLQTDHGEVMLLIRSVVILPEDDPEETPPTYGPHVENAALFTVALAAYLCYCARHNIQDDHIEDDDLSRSTCVVDENDDGTYTVHVVIGTRRGYVDIRLSLEL